MGFNILAIFVYERYDVYYLFAYILIHMCSGRANVRCHLEANSIHLKIL